MWRPSSNPPLGRRRLAAACAAASLLACLAGGSARGSLRPAANVVAVQPLVTLTKPQPHRQKHPLRVLQLRVCPASETHLGGPGGGGAAGVVCNGDWSEAPFSPEASLVCSAEELYGAGRSMVMTLLRDGAPVISTTPARLTSSPFYSWLKYVWNAGIPSGTYACQVKINRAVVVEKTFALTAPTVEVTNFAVCPESDTHVTSVDQTTGQPNLACNKDWSTAPLPFTNGVVCSAEELYGAGQVLQMVLQYNGNTWAATSDSFRLTVPDGFTWIYLRVDQSVPPGEWSCQVRLDGVVAADLGFTVTGCGACAAYRQVETARRRV